MIAMKKSIEVLKIEVSIVQNKYDSCLVERCKLVDELTEANAFIAELTKELEALIAENLKLRSKKEQLLTERKLKQDASLASLYQRLDRMNKLVYDLEFENAELKNDLDAKNEELRLKSEELSSKSTELTSKSEALMLKSEELSLKSAELALKSDELIKTLSNGETQASLLDKIRQEHDNIKKNYYDHERQIEDLHDQIKNLTESKQMACDRFEGSVAEIANLNDRLKNLAELKQKADEDFFRVKGENEAMGQELNRICDNWHRKLKDIDEKYASFVNLVAKFRSFYCSRSDYVVKSTGNVGCDQIATVQNGRGGPSGPLSEGECSSSDVRNISSDANAGGPESGHEHEVKRLKLLLNNSRLRNAQLHKQMRARDNKWQSLLLSTRSRGFNASGNIKTGKRSPKCSSLDDMNNTSIASGKSNVPNRPGSQSSRRRKPQLVSSSSQSSPSGSSSSSSESSTKVPTSAINTPANGPDFSQNGPANALVPLSAGISTESGVITGTEAGTAAPPSSTDTARFGRWVALRPSSRDPPAQNESDPAKSNLNVKQLIKSLLNASQFEPPTGPNPSLSGDASGSLDAIPEPDTSNRFWSADRFKAVSVDGSGRSTMNGPCHPVNPEADPISSQRQAVKLNFSAIATRKLRYLSNKMGQSFDSSSESD